MMNVDLISVTPYALALIEKAGRTCYKSQPGDLEIIRRWIASGHESVLEHASATFRISGVSRSLTHQLVRHRIASYSQESQRYVDGSSFEYVTPPSIHSLPEALERYERMMEEIRKTYRDLRTLGIRKEDARYILPNATCTEIVMTMNFRSFRNLFRLRLDKHAQWEIRAMCHSMLDLIRQEAPLVFEDIDDTKEEQ